MKGKTMTKPNMLKPGDTVALISLSSGIAGESPFSKRLEQGIRRLKSDFGLNVIIMPNALKGINFLEQNPKARADDLMAAFKDKQIKAVISMIGGDDTIRLLPYINFDVIKENPKIFMGYSDTTINHLMMYKTSLTSFYGPSVLAEFAENGAMHEYTKTYIHTVLFEQHNTLEILPSPRWTSEILEWSDPKTLDAFRSMTADDKGYELLQGAGIIQGKLLGGCADVLPMVFGTDLWPPKEHWYDRILFLETSEDYPSPDSIKYLLRGLVAQGIIERINGIIFGKPRDEMYYDEYKEVLLQVIGHEAKRPDLPILYNMNFGHTSPMCILPYGALAEIDCDHVSFRLLESSVQ